ncbi:MAG: DUF1150 family protein [Proteobacteria bacterium]|nr:DUF1150 family protein [Pseudomonadota bacterium]
MIGQTSFTQLSVQDFTALGVQAVAYLKPITDKSGATVFAIRAADGTHMAVVPSRDYAIAAIRQHGLEPADVH